MKEEKEEREKSAAKLADELTTLEGRSIKSKLKSMGTLSAQDLPARIAALELRVALLEGKK